MENYWAIRCGVAPIRIEIGIFEGLPEEGRLCPFCNVIEDESHVLLDYHLYNDLWTALYETAIFFLPDFANYDRTDKLRVILSDFSLATVPSTYPFCTKHWQVFTFRNTDIEYLNIFNKENGKHSTKLTFLQGYFLKTYISIKVTTLCKHGCS